MDESEASTQRTTGAIMTARRWPSLSINAETKWTAGCCRLCGGQTKILNPAWLRRQRQLAGFSLRALARRVGVSAPYLSDIERGARNCTQLLQVTYEQLRNAKP